MSSGSSSGRITTYNALPPVKQQKTFPERRRSVKARPTIPRLRKSQSTLTQLDFITPTSSRVEAIDNSSEEDFEEPRPKKKRRKSKFDEKEAGQSTLTQFDRVFSARKSEIFGLEEDDFQIWEDYDPDMIMDGIAERQHTRKRTLPWLRQNSEGVENRLPSPEIPETSQNVMEPSLNVAVDPSAATVIFQTPRKVRFQEVPSSQTPPSTVVSAKTPTQSNTAEISPLKQRSSNVQSAPATAASSPGSQNISMKMLERIRFETRKVPLNDLVDQQTSRENESAVVAPVSTALDSTVEPGVTSLSRMSTIQDSQSEDAGLTRVNSAETVVRPRRKLQRVSTVQDSQYDDEDFLSEPNQVTDDDYFESHLIVESQYAGFDTQQDYFDPANSALDRDALRFGCTQTQRLLSDIHEEDADDETDDDDLDRGCRGSTAQRAGLLHTDPQRQDVEQPFVVSARRGIYTKPPLVMKPHSLLHSGRQDLRDDSAYESGGMAQHEEVQVLSSSPPPRPSQVSTVVPTQASLPQPPSRKDSSSRPLPIPTMIEPFSAPMSPHNPIYHSQLLPSSPLPLPPWSSPDRHRFVDKGQDGDGTPINSSQLARLVDYSLPPPPPLSSSGRQTPVSSST